MPMRGIEIRAVTGVAGAAAAATAAAVRCTLAFAGLVVAFFAVALPEDAAGLEPDGFAVALAWAGCCAVSLASALISRDLRREALLAWSTPFSAALSRALIARRTSSLVILAASGTAGRRARETSVLTAERVERFRSRFLNEARTRFLAGWVFAMRAVIIADQVVRADTATLRREPGKDCAPINEGD